jgi:hypothetical protein
MTDKTMRAYSREELLALTPARYLKEGFVDNKGKPKPELLTGYATAAATQLLAAEVAPQELAFTYEALRQTLPMQEGPPPKRIRGAVEEALGIVRGMIQQPNNPGLTKWTNDATAMVKGPADIDAFMAHFLAVLRLYSVLVASRSP